MPCVSDLTSYEIDYDDLSESSENIDIKKIRTAKGDDLSPARLPLLRRIRSVEIVFEDDMSLTETAMFDDKSVRSDSDDSTKCVDDLEHVTVERDGNTPTLHAESESSNDDSLKDLSAHFHKSDVSEISPLHNINENTSQSLNLPKTLDSGLFTEEPSSSNVDFNSKTFDDALVSHTEDAVNVECITILKIACERKLYEYIDSNSDSSDDNTAVYDDVDKRDSNISSMQSPLVVDDDEITLYDSSELQYDSIYDLGKF